jgi:hypothetical protein
VVCAPDADTIEPDRVAHRRATLDESARAPDRSPGLHSTGLGEFVLGRDALARAYVALARTSSQAAVKA